MINNSDFEDCDLVQIVVCDMIELDLFSKLVVFGKPKSEF